MGSCFSKKNDSSSSSSGAVATGSTSVESVDPNKSSNKKTQKVEIEQKIKKKIVQEEEEAKKEKEEESTVKKEIFVIKHRKSHDRGSPPADGALYSSTSTEETGKNICNGSNNVVVKTSSCTKEEVDAILIQCGRLSRSNSSGKTASSTKKNSGSKRSFDFDHNDHENDQNESAPNADYDSKRRANYSYYDDDEAAEKRQHRHRHRQSGRPSPQGRRRTPSREREQQKKQQRSGSRERGSGNENGRRVSRSPGRRSETTPNSTTSVTTATVNANANSSSNKIGKMVYVPATVSSLVMDKSNNGGNANNAGAVETTAIKRISVKRNVGEAAAPVPGSRSAASPRSQSPARTNAKGSNENQQPSLSRSSSRKAEQSPYRRNPLSEIDPNSLAYPQSAGNKASCTNNTREQNRNKEIEVQGMPKEFTNVLNQKPNSEMSNNRVVGNKSAREQQQIGEESKTEPSKTGNITVTTVVGSCGDGLKAQTLTRSRSSRRSRDLDLNPEALLNPPPSYTTLLLEDIQNFHQKTVPCFSLPPCLNKACSILEAVADLNSTTSSNLSCALSEDRRSPPTDQYKKNECNFSSGANLVGKKLSKAKDPFVESEVLVTDDIMEPSFHKYVTVRRGGTLDGEDMEEQESLGSNSFAGSGQQLHWGFSSSSWEPNSADSTDRWTSRSNTREQNQSPLGFQRHALSEPDHDVNETKQGLSGKKKDYDHQQNGICRGRVSASKGLHAIPVVAAASLT